jgi:tRNA dimethylallyltransferase
MTWFKRDKEITWFHPDEETAILDHIRQITEPTLASG